MRAKKGRILNKQRKKNKGKQRENKLHNFVMQTNETAIAIECMKILWIFRSDKMQHVRKDNWMVVKIRLVLHTERICRVRVSKFLPCPIHLSVI